MQLQQLRYVVSEKFERRWETAGGKIALGQIKVKWGLKNFFILNLFQSELRKISKEQLGTAGPLV